jgi:hypothetical protein
MMWWNFVKAFLRYQYAAMAGYKLIASPEAMARRSQLCETCDFYTEGTCARCGCLIVSKVLLNTEKCPVGRWPSLWIKRTDKPLVPGE